MALFDFAASPTRRSSAVKLTTEGTVRFPVSDAIISTPPFFHTATMDMHVARSIPITKFCVDILYRCDVTRI
jgi:hypothetical protein